MKGQSLIEVLLALGAAVAIITGITAVVTSALNNAQFSRNQNLANQYAQQGMEVVRAIRDKSWDDFIDLPVNNCLPEGSTELVQRTGPDCDGLGNVGIFIREVTLNNMFLDCGGPPPQNTKVTVKVQWSDSKCSSGNFCHEVKLISCFSQQTVGAP